MVVLVEAFLYSWEYLYLTNLELTLGLTKMNPSSKNEASKLTNFLQSACKKVSVASNRASFAILYRQHEMICYHTNNSSKQLLHCDSLTQFLIMLYMLYPSDQMISSVGRIIAKKKTKKTSEHSRTESTISPPSLSRQVFSKSSSYYRDFDKKIQQNFLQSFLPCKNLSYALNVL